MSENETNHTLYATPKTYWPRGGSGPAVIAEIIISSVPAVRIRIIARRRGGRVSYTVKADDGAKVTPAITERDGPLTFAELTRLISQTPIEDGHELVGLISGSLAYAFGPDGEDLPTPGGLDRVSAEGFVGVTSKYYPELERWAREEAQAWLAARRQR